VSITRLQQARQMYAMGQRVAKTLDGSRPGYRGDYSYGDSSSKDYDPGEGTNQAGKSAPTASINKGSDNYRAPTYDAPPTVQQMKDAKRDYEVGVAGGYAKDQVVGPYGPYQPGTYQFFKDTRPKVNIPNLGLSGMFLNLFNKGVNSPIQKFADFTTAKNRNYFMDEVVRAGRYTLPDGKKINYGTVSDMTNEELEAAYKGYLSDRLSGATDAYGNPLNQGGGEGANQGIATLYNYDMFDDTETKNANDPFVSRFLQNQPSDIREGIESKMQDYYTV